MQTLRTARLELQPLSLEHADRIFDLFQDDELSTFTHRGGPITRDEFREGVRYVAGRISKDGLRHLLNWECIHRSTGELIGQIEVSMGVESRVSNLAYTIKRSQWRQGYAKESCAAVIDHMFTVWGTRRVGIEMDVRNVASVRVAESLGARRVAFKPKAMMLKGEWSDEYHYEILRPNTLP